MKYTLKKLRKVLRHMPVKKATRKKGYKLTGSGLRLAGEGCCSRRKMMMKMRAKQMKTF
tara:strand:+ start:434 stop:610 length:177 start_codon:yes stop_codon:yes gene_type:complete